MGVKTVSGDPDGYGKPQFGTKSPETDKF